MTADSITRVGVAIVESNDSFLVGVRSETQTLSGLHEFPGGKCLPGEEPMDCAIRECLEETGISVKPIRLIETKVHEYDHATVAVSFVLCGLAESNNQTRNMIGNFIWIHRSKLSECQFPDANKDIVRMLSEGGITPER